jgi:hypothetical protein
VLELSEPSGRYDFYTWPVRVQIKSEEHDWQFLVNNSGDAFWIIPVQPKPDEGCIHMRIMAEMHCEKMINSEVLLEWLGAGKCC